jgi:hypothetical protein
VLFEDPLVVITAPNNSLARRRKIEFAELGRTVEIAAARVHFWVVSHKCSSHCWPCCSIGEEVIE